MGRGIIANISFWRVHCRVNLDMVIEETNSKLPLKWLIYSLIKFYSNNSILNFLIIKTNKIPVLNSSIPRLNAIYYE